MRVLHLAELPLGHAAEQGASILIPHVPFRHDVEERLLELEAQHGKALNDIAQAEERCRAASEELAAVTERLAVSEQSLEGHRQSLEEKRAALQNVENEQRAQQEALRQAQLETINELKAEFSIAPPALWAPFILQGAQALGR